MNTSVDNKIIKEENVKFAALKMIELLYKEGMITEANYRNIIQEHCDIVDRDSFK